MRAQVARLVAIMDERKVFGNSGARFMKELLAEADSRSKKLSARSGGAVQSNGAAAPAGDAQGITAATRTCARDLATSSREQRVCINLVANLAVHHGNGTRHVSMYGISAIVLMVRKGMSASAAGSSVPARRLPSGARAVRRRLDRGGRSQRPQQRAVHAVPGRAAQGASPPCSLGWIQHIEETLSVSHETPRPHGA